MKIDLKEFHPSLRAYEIDPTKTYLIVMMDEDMDDQIVNQVRDRLRRAGLKNDSVLLGLSGYSELTVLEKADV